VRIKLSHTCSKKSFDERARTIPKNLYADTDQQKRREPEDYVHAGGAENRGEAVGKAVAEINCGGDDGGADDGCGDCENISSEMTRSVGAKRDGGGDRAGADRKGQSERVKSAAENVGGVHVLLNLAALVGIFLFEHGPAVGNDDEAATDLHDRNGDAEKGENVRADKIGSDDEDKTVEGDAPGEEPAGGGSVVSGEGEKYGAATDGIDDGEEGADDKKGTFCDFEQGILRRKEYSRGAEKVWLTRRTGRSGRAANNHPPPPIFCKC